jgi:hypothetical protein
MAWNRLSPFSEKARNLAALRAAPFHSFVDAPCALRIEHALYHVFARFYGKPSTWTNAAEMPHRLTRNVHRVVEHVDFTPATFDAVQVEAPLVLGPIAGRLTSIQTSGIIRSYPAGFTEARATQEIFLYWNCISTLERVVPRYDDDPRLRMDPQILADELPLLRRLCQFNRSQEEMEAGAGQFVTYVQQVMLPRARRVTRWAAELRELPEDEVWATEEYALEQPPAPARRHQHMGLAPAQRREQRKVLIAAYNELVDVCQVDEEVMRPPACIEDCAAAGAIEGAASAVQQRMFEASACRRALTVLGVGNWASPYEHFTAVGLRSAWLVEVKAIILMFLLADVAA